MADARFAKPLDIALMERLARKHTAPVTIEESVAGGFASLVMQHLAWRDLLEKDLKFHPMTPPDRIVDHNTQAKRHEEAGLNTAQIVATVLAALGQNDVAQKVGRYSLKPSRARTI